MINRRVLVVPYDVMHGIITGRVRVVFPREYCGAELHYVTNIEECAAFGLVYDSAGFDDVAPGCMIPRDVPTFEACGVMPDVADQATLDDAIRIVNAFVEAVINGMLLPTSAVSDARGAIQTMCNGVAALRAELERVRIMYGKA